MRCIKNARTLHVSTSLEIYSQFHLFEPHNKVGAQHCCAPTMWSIYLKIAVS